MSASDRGDLFEPIRPLTAAELRVLELVAAGLSSSEIGARLFRSRQGITYHIGNLMMQFGAESRTELVARAYALGIFSRGVWPPEINPTFLRPLRVVGRTTG